MTTTLHQRLAALAQCTALAIFTQIFRSPADSNSKQCECPCHWHYPTYCHVTEDRHKPIITRITELSTHTANQARVHRGCSWNPHFNTMESDRQQHDLPAACVITQQYSSTTFVSLHFHSPKEKFGALLDMSVQTLKFFSTAWDSIWLNLNCESWVVCLYFKTD